MKPSYEHYLDVELREQAESLEALKLNKNLFLIVAEHGEKFAPFKYDYKKRYTSLYYVPRLSMELQLHLAENDSVKDAYPLIDALIQDPRLEMVMPLPKHPSGSAEYVYCIFKEKLPDEESCQRLRVYIFFDRVSTCKKVGTGKFAEIMKVVCSDEAF